MGLELNRAFGRHGRLAVVVVLQQGVVHHELLVEPDAHARADHEDADCIPLAERPVSQHERILARRAGAVVPETAGALISTY